MASIIENQIQVLEAYKEIIACLRRIKMALSMHTDTFASAREIRKKEKKWPVGLFKSLTAVINTQVGNMITLAEKLDKSDQELNKLASTHLNALAEKIESWYTVVKSGDVITGPKTAWAQLTGATLQNFLETVRADLVKLALQDKINKSIYANLNRDITEEFNKFREEAFKEVHAGV